MVPIRKLVITYIICIHYLFTWNNCKQPFWLTAKIQPSEEISDWKIPPESWWKKWSLFFLSFLSSKLLEWNEMWPSRLDTANKPVKTVSWNPFCTRMKLFFMHLLCFNHIMFSIFILSNLTRNQISRQILLKIIFWFDIFKLKQSCFKLLALCHVCSLLKIQIR